MSLSADNWTSSGLPVSTEEITDFDEDYVDDLYLPVSISKVDSFTAPEEEEVVYRACAGVKQPGHLFGGGGALKEDLRALHDGRIGKPSLGRLQEIPIKEKAPAWASIAAKPSFANENKVSSAPKTPFHLEGTHFFCKYLDLNSVVNATENILQDIPEVSHTFESSTCSWKTDCAEGYSQCSMDVCVYKAKRGAKSSNSLPYIIECNRKEGDHNVFRRIYTLIREKLGEGGATSNTSDPSSMSTGEFPSIDGSDNSVAKSIPVHFDDVTDEPDEASQRATIKLMLDMAAEPRQEARLLAAQFFCDITADEHMCTSTLCASPACVAALINLVQGPADLHGENVIRYSAFLAISNLSRANMATKTAIIDAGILPVVVAAITNGTYKDAHMRRECASILNNLSCQPRLAKKIVSVLGYSAVETLFPLIDNLKDERMKLQAGMAKNNLMSVFCSA